MSDAYYGFDLTQRRTLEALLSDTVLSAGSIGSTELAAGAVTSAKIADGAIVNADVNASADIALSKLADVAAGDDGLSAGTLQDTLQAAFTAIANLNTWAAALATKLNADAGVTDTNYDTDPQA